MTSTRILSLVTSCILLYATALPSAGCPAIYPAGSQGIAYTVPADLLPDLADLPEIKSEGNQGEELEYLLRQWKELYGIMLKEEKSVQNNFRDATNAQFKAGEQVRIAETNKKIVDPVRLATLQEDYEKSVEKLRLAKLQQKEFKALLEKAKKINLKPLALTEKKYTKMRTDFNLYLGTYSPEKKLNLEAESTKPVAGDPKATPKKNQPATVKEPANQVAKEPANQPVKEQTKEPIKEVSKEPTKETSKTKAKESAAASKPPAKAPPAAPLAVAAEIPANVIDPVMVNKRPSSFEVKPYASQPYACIFETDAKDSLTGLSRLELTPEILFTHTDPDLRPYFKDKDLITCRGRLSAIGPYIYLSIEFQIASSHSQSNFGSLQEGSLLRLKLMNDTYVSLYNLKTNNGRIDPYTGNTIFVGQYAIGKQEMKTIKASALDKMRVMWSTGFEDYDVYNIDLLINQNNCLMSRK